MHREECFHCDIRDLIISNPDKYTPQGLGEGLALALAEHIVLNADYKSDAECKMFAVMGFMRAMDAALQMKNSGEKVVNAGDINKGFMQ